MHPAAALGSGSLLLVLGIALRGPSTPPVAPPAAAVQDPAVGHLVLVVTGTVRELSVAHAAAKPDPWGGAPRAVVGPFRTRILAADGTELISVPLDLSRFDTDPLHLGRPFRVTGCDVKPTAIATLVNLPQLPGAARYEFLRGDTLLGAESASRIEALARGDR